MNENLITVHKFVYSLVRFTQQIKARIDDGGSVSLTRLCRDISSGFPVNFTPIKQLISVAMKLYYHRHVATAYPLRQLAPANDQERLFRSNVTAD